MEGELEKAFSYECGQGFGFHVYGHRLDIAILPDGFNLPPALKYDCKIDVLYGIAHLSIQFDMYANIPHIFNTILAFGQSFTTFNGGYYRATFKPGETFSLRTLELKIVESFMLLYTEDTWQRLKSVGGLAPLKHPWNWSTEEGKALCKRIRSEGGMKPLPKEKSRFELAWFNETAQKHGTLHFAAWRKE